jgi:cell division protein FtsB
MNINDNYNNRLEQEVTALKREIIILESENTELDCDLKQAHAEVAFLRMDNKQLRQSITALRGEPTNSL